MKKLYIYLSIILLTAWSCSEKENMDEVGNWEISNPTVSLPVNDAFVALNENNPTSSVRFEWAASTTTNKFLVQYKMVLLPKGSTDYEHPLLSVTPSNSGKELFVTPTAAQIDYALWVACYPAGAEVKLDWAVIAKAIEKTGVTTQSITFKRFESEYYPSTLFITGEATENGADVTKAIPMRAFKTSDGATTGVFELYTHLTVGSTYFFRDQANENSKKIGGSENALTCGTTIQAPASGEYKVTVDLVNKKYSLLKIDRWSLVGDAVEGGWGGDVPLAYIGNSVWEKEIMFYQPYDGASFILRANGDWGIAMKRIKGSQTTNNKGGKLILESEGQATNVPFEDLAGTTGLHKVTVSLGADGYAYSLTKIAVVVETIIGKSTDITSNAVTGTFPITAADAPAELYLLEDGKMIVQFVKDGDVFKSQKYFALQAAKSYSFNSKADGTGTKYDADDDGTVSVDHDQAYQINIDFAADEVSWKHYNLKLFHWNEDGGGWDQRQELAMTYTHPYKFEVTGNLTAGYHSKFNSPWDIQFGTAATALSGTMTNNGPNYKGIVATGSYKATIVIVNDYQSGEYSFVKQ